MVHQSQNVHTNTACRFCFWNTARVERACYILVISMAHSHHTFSSSVASMFYLNRYRYRYIYICGWMDGWMDGWMGIYVSPYHSKYHILYITCYEIVRLSLKLLCSCQYKQWSYAHILHWQQRVSADWLGWIGPNSMSMSAMLH